MPISVITPAGVFKQPEELRMLVASSASFQARVGAVDQTSAMESVHTYAALTDFDQVAPMAVISGHEMGRANAGVGSWHTSGSLRLMFELNYDLPTTAQLYENQKVQFLNEIATFMQEMEANERTDNALNPGETFLNVTRYTLTQEPWMEAVAEQALPAVNATPEVIWSCQFAVEFA